MCFSTPKGEQEDHQEIRQIPWTNFHGLTFGKFIYTTDWPMWSNSVISRLGGKLRDETFHLDYSTLKKEKMVGDGGICSKGWEFGG